jgi:HSP20 family protein
VVNLFLHSESDSNSEQSRSSKHLLSRQPSTQSIDLSDTIFESLFTNSSPNSIINMPFFPQAYLSSESQFLNFLSELDKEASQQTQKQAPPAQCVRRCQPREAREETFTPHFDVTETPTTYELFGELPGLAQEDLNIEFTDAQTVVVKGKTVRAGTTIPTPEPAEEVKAIDNSDASSEKSHTATVEDDYDEADTPLATPATTATAVSEKTSEPRKAEAPKPKFWVSERKVGSFARSFSFSQRIEHDNVKAVLKNGVLHLVIPKVTKTGKIAVTVA